MAEQLFLTVKDKILHMKGPYAVAVIRKGPVNDLLLGLRLHLMGVDQVHGVQYHLHIGGINVLQKPLHPGRAVQRVVKYALHPHDNAQFLGRSHDFPHTLKKQPVSVLRIGFLCDPKIRVQASGLCSHHISPYDSGIFHVFDETRHLCLTPGFNGVCGINVAAQHSHMDLVLLQLPGNGPGKSGAVMACGKIVIADGLSKCQLDLADIMFPHLGKQLFHFHLWT